MPGPLAGLTIVECGNLVSAPYAGKLLADLGAGVIKIEEPGGDSARLRGPFPNHDPHPEKSGLFLYLNCNKKSVLLDLETEAGRSSLDAVVKTADGLIHNYRPAQMSTRGLDYDRLAAVNPRLVMASITPFGLQGPRRDWNAYEPQLIHGGGVTFLNGDGPGSGDRAPLKPAGMQADFQAGANAAMAMLAAIFAARRNGKGDHIDISELECVTAIVELAFPYWPYLGLIPSRLGHPPIQPIAIFPCSDGYLMVCCIEEQQWRSFVELMGSPDWAGWEVFADRIARSQNWDVLEPFLAEWLADKSVADIYHRAQARRIPFAPCSTMADLYHSPHLAERGFFVEVDHPEAGKHSYPGNPYIFEATPWAITSPAPSLGQHTAEVLGALA